MQTTSERVENIRARDGHPKEENRRQQLLAVKPPRLDLSLRAPASYHVMQAMRERVLHPPVPQTAGDAAHRQQKL